MRVRWFGQSAFWLAEGGTSVALDPFGSMEDLTARGLRFTYPPIRDVAADLVLITHEHVDHNAAAVIGGAPRVIRSTAGTFDSPVGEVVAIASEHDDAAGTRRGPNTIFVFGLGGHRVCHFGDFGQRALRPEQAAAIGRPDLLFVPVGGGPTVDRVAAAKIARSLRARWVVPMHYRTEALNFLESVDAFLAQFAPAQIRRPAGPEFDTTEVPDGAEPPIVLVPVVPVG
jgi:L-ascorbate metabolism protein UlaG (beta-lactamase superfamily)